MKILVTGHRGFIGTHLTAMLKRDGHDVMGIDLRENGDIRFAALPSVDAVFHLAAQTDAMNDNARADADVNIMGTLRILERYRHKVVFASSSMVNYASTPYAISKLAGEKYALFHEATVVRLPNIYGAGGHSCIDKFRDGDVMVIFGDGEQVRTYAPVEAACAAFWEYVGAGGIHIVPGRNMTVNEIAAKFPGKTIVRHTPRKNDLQHAPQVMPVTVT